MGGTAGADVVAEEQRHEIVRGGTVEVHVAGADANDLGDEAAVQLPL